MSKNREHEGHDLPPVGREPVKKKGPPGHYAEEGGDPTTPTPPPNPPIPPDDGGDGG